MRKLFIAVASLLVLAACSTAQIQTAQSILAAAPAGIQDACNDALAAAAIAGTTVKGGAANTVGAISAGVVVGCTTAEGVARLVADASSAEWLGQQAGTLKTLAAAPAAGS